MFMRHWFRFCEGLFPRDSFGQDLLGRVRLCHLKRIAESINAKPADDVFKDLRDYGLVRPSR
jgi:hypothetical protein